MIALLTSYDHIGLPAGAALQLPQQWGVWCIAASVALVVADAQRIQAENEANAQRVRDVISLLDEYGGLACSCAPLGSGQVFKRSRVMAQRCSISEMILSTSG